MKVVRNVKELRETVAFWRRDGHRVGLVPTMGALHEGHLSLISLSKQHAGKTVASLFVNPTQFAPNEDFDAYPRNEDDDLGKFKEAGTDLVYAPPVSELYPDGHATSVTVGGPSDDLESVSRPHFFTGVATVVSMLFNQVRPDIAVFGEKDYQQLCVIRRMVRDLHMPVDVIGGPTIRETGGLAMSSRNQYLTVSERGVAPLLHRTITDIARRFRTGEEVDMLCDWGTRNLRGAGFGTIDYIAVRDAETLKPVISRDRPARVLAAAWLGKARLIDNVPV